VPVSSPFPNPNGTTTEIVLLNAAAPGAPVHLPGGSITGGTISTLAGGTLAIDAGPVPTIANASIVNDGTTTVGSTGHPATLDIGGTVSLLHGGNLTL